MQSQTATTTNLKPETLPLLWIWIIRLFL
jgi:hypothetical protein